MSALLPCGLCGCITATPAEVAALRAERDSAWDTLDQVIGGTAQALNCDRDNEAILEAATGIQSQNVRLRAEVERLRGAAKDATAHLVAAVSLLERGGKKAAPSNKMFEQMLVDYKRSVERARAALAKEPGDEG